MSPDAIGIQGGRSPDNVGVNFKTGVPTSRDQRSNQGAQQINRGALILTGWDGGSFCRTISHFAWVL